MRPQLSPADKAFWLILPWLSGAWRDALMIVQPATVLRWHRIGCRARLCA
jgi:putative transposase